MKRIGRGEVIKVADLFEKYTRLLYAPEGVVIRTFQEVVADTIGAAVLKEQCSYTPSSRTLKLSVSGPLKSEILLRKDEILLHMKGRLNDKNTPEHII